MRYENFIFTFILLQNLKLNDNKIRLVYYFNQCIQLTVSASLDCVQDKEKQHWKINQIIHLISITESTN